jgi:putative hemolysin
MIPSNRARKLARVSRLKARKPLRALKKVKKLNPVKFFQNRRFPLRNFECKVHVYQSAENFILKTAESPFEMKEVLRLRHDVFYKELQDKVTSNQMDIDELDNTCDHLLIIDKKSRKIVGTYRLISSTFSDKFYSEGEFDLSGLLELPGNKLELGRACIHPDFRTGAIINLLWKGIAEYIKKTDTKYLFGCASVNTVDKEQAGRILGYLEQKELSSNQYGVKPIGKYEAGIEALPVAPTTEKEIPALISSYILAGAKFYGPPALDEDFQCFDFFMMLKVEEMSRLFRRRYKLDV